MKHSVRLTITKLAVLVMLLVVLIATSTAPAVKSRPLYSVLEEERYYSDATYSTLVGKCVENGCTGAYSCWGQQTEFVVNYTRGIVCD